MSGAQKAVLIALGLLALAFVLVIAWGSTQPACTGKARDCMQAYKPSGGMKTMRKLFSSAGPVVKLPQKRYEFNAPARQQIEIAASSDEIRTLKLKQVQGVFKLSLKNAQAGEDLKDQSAPLPQQADDPDNRVRMTFAVTRGGGLLTIDCLLAPCVLQVE
jgi:hypothetical protein